MSVAGLCHVCEAAMAGHSCSQCGQPVCDEHWNDGTAACTACAGGRQQ